MNMERAQSSENRIADGSRAVKPRISTTSVSRRDFLAQTAMGAGALSLGARGSFCAETGASPIPGTGSTPRFPLIGFSKPFQKYTPEQTAELVATVGWDGIECPVRAKGQIEPERAPDELPRFVAALRQQNKDVHLVATDITSITQPHADTVLRTMSRLGLKRLRLGFWTYRSDQSPAGRLKEIAPALRDLADTCKDLGLQAGFQNHSGNKFVGAPVWDVYSMIQSLDPRHIGFCFDIGHATVEGGLSWPIEARLAEPFYTAVFVKDFFWKKEAGGWKDTWCPLGEGMVNRAFFAGLKKSAYCGPICQHHEYELGDTHQMIAHLQRDLKVLQDWLA